jgi:hypothetical protein
MSAWTPEMVAAHNARVANGKAGASAKPVTVETAAVRSDLVVAQSSDTSGLNKTEREWYYHLKSLYPAGFLGAQNITLKLADDTRYTPDFWTINANGQLEFWETKGFMRDDAHVKIKVAARMFPWARFILVTKPKGSGWKEEEVKP